MSGEAVEDLGTAKFYVCPQAAMWQAESLVPYHALYRDQPTLAARIYPAPTLAGVQVTRTLHDVEQLIQIAEVKKADAAARRNGGMRNR